MRILSIDPANSLSAFAITEYKDTLNIIKKGKIDNCEMREIVLKEEYDILVIEGMQNFNNVVGKTVFETCYWIGRFIELGLSRKKEYYIMYRTDVKLNLCKSRRSKDKDIRRALIERFATFDFKNGKGVKKTPDIFYGVSADVWSALAIGITYFDKNKKR